MQHNIPNKISGNSDCRLDAHEVSSDFKSFPKLEDYTVKPVATIRTSFPEKFGIPRQSGLSTASRAYICFEGEFRNPDCIRGIEQYTHLWLLWKFSTLSEKQWSPTVRPPRLGGNQHVGVFATRSPFRPNHIGLSSVQLLEVLSDDSEHHEFFKKLGISGPVLVVSGADLMDGTPILDIKPYLPYTDSHPEASGGFSEQGLLHRLTVNLSNVTSDHNYLNGTWTEEEKKEIIDLLELDPRPSYHDDSERIYGMRYKEWDVHFKVEDGIVYLL